MLKEVRINKIILISVLSVLLALFIIINIFLYFHATKCKDVNCFTNALASCNRANWIKEDSRASWLYTIKGMKSENCKINVKLLQIKSGSLSNQNLEGKTMDCYIPIGSSDFPEKQISKCHGLLKEDIQNLIIQRMHAYLLENIGEISQNFEGI